MSTTVANVAIGLSMQTQDFVRPVHHAGEVVSTFTETINQSLVPATAAVGGAGEQASRGFGLLEETMELLALRSISTETSLANLIHTTNRIARQNRGAVTSNDELANSYSNLDKTQRQLISQANGRKIVDTTDDLAQIETLTDAIQRLRSVDEINIKVGRVRSITDEIESLTTQRDQLPTTNLADRLTSSPDAVPVGLTERQEIEQRINSLMSERLGLDIQLRSGVDGRSKEQIEAANIQERINRILGNRLTTLSTLSELHESNLAALRRQAEVPTRKELQTTSQSLAKELKEAQAEEEELRLIISKKTEAQEDATAEITKATEARKRGKTLSEKHLAVERKIVESEEDQASAVARVALAQRGVENSLDSQLRFRRQQSAELDAFTKDLRTSLNIQGSLTHEARRTVEQFRELQAKQLDAFNLKLSVAQRRTGKVGSAFQQLGYGLEDAVSQFDTRGLTGALQGATNNISAAASVLPGYGAAAVAVVSTLTLLAVKLGAADAIAKVFSGTLENQRKLLEGHAHHYELVADAQDRFLSQSRKLAEIGTQGPDDLTSSFKKLTEQLEDARINRERLRVAERVANLEQAKERVDKELEESPDDNRLLIRRDGIVRNLNSLMSTQLESAQAVRRETAAIAGLELQRREIVANSGRAADLAIEDIFAKREKPIEEEGNKKSDPRDELDDVMARRKELRREIRREEVLVALRGKNEVAAGDRLLKLQQERVNLAQKEADLQTAIEQEVLNSRKEQIELKKTELNLERDRQKQILDDLKSDREKLRGELKQRSTPATRQNAVEAGSAEAGRIIADAMLSGINDRENQPIVDELANLNVAIAEQTDKLAAAIDSVQLLKVAG